jgi:glutathione S-transferase
MPILYHAPNSRSSTILALIEEMDVADRFDIVEVTVARRDGSGGPDPRNPHPEGKVPYLVNGDDHVRERGAIVAYLTDLFPEAEMGRPIDHPQRGAYLGWLFYYQGVMEPVLVQSWAGLDHPAFHATFRDMDAVWDRLREGLDGCPWLLGADYSAIDLLLSSPFLWMPDAAPKDPILGDWIARCGARPIPKAIAEREQAVRAG